MMAVAKASDNAKSAANEEAVATTTADIEAQMARLRDDIAALAETVAAFGTERAGSYRRRAEELVGEAADASRSAVRSAKTELYAAEENLEASIRRNPLQAVGIAAGLGFLAALLTRR